MVIWQKELTSEPGNGKIEIVLWKKWGELQDTHNIRMNLHPQDKKSEPIELEDTSRDGEKPENGIAIVGKAYNRLIRKTKKKT